MGYSERSSSARLALPQLGSFRLLGELGRGGFGVVFHALDTETGEEVALKVLTQGLSSARATRRFEREAQIAKRLDHPGIVRLSSSGVVDGSAYLAFELVHGANTLRDVLPHAGRRRLVEIVRDAARALGHAHARGVVHRDVKPENLLVDLAGQVRVADFGVSTATGLTRLTRSGALVGTPLYMSPEQLTGRREAVGPASDVWALGVILYEALAGEPPYEAASIVQLMDLVHSPPPPPRALAPDLTPDAEAICMRALELDPARRHPDGEALARDLDRLLQHSPEASGPSPTPPRQWFLAGLLLLLGAGLAAAVWTSGDRSEPAPPVLPAPAPPAPEPDPPDPAPPELPAAIVAREMAKAGDAQAMVRYAYALQVGDGLPTDPLAAATWYRRASEAGNPEGTANLGYLYQNGIGVPRNYPRAQRLYRKAIEQGSKRALVHLGIVYERGLGVRRDPRRAADLYRRAHDLGDLNGSTNLGAFYQDGVGVPRDLARARELYRLAALGGYAPAQYRLALLYLRGIGVAKDGPEAKRWLELSARQGRRDAMLELSKLLTRGKDGVPADPVAAEEWLRRASR